MVWPQGRFLRRWQFAKWLRRLTDPAAIAKSEGLDTSRMAQAGSGSNFWIRSFPLGIERHRELRRRRHRRKKLAILQRKVKSGKHSEVQHIKDQIRKLTPGAEMVLANWGIADESA